MPGSTGHLLSDEVGLVTADREIGVFDSTIHPGSEGEFDFEIINPHAKNIVYEMDVKQYYNGQEVTDFPMFYKLKMKRNDISYLEVKKSIGAIQESCEYAEIDSRFVEIIRNPILRFFCTFAD